MSGSSSCLRAYRWLIPSLVSCVLLLSGCGHFHPGASATYVYVTPKRMYLRDRVAVVANRVAEVTNGERLKVLESGRRFLKVKTPNGAVGWIESHGVIDQEEYGHFQNLARQHANQPAVATGLLYNELYMHIAPGRKAQRFYLLPPNTKISMLERASVPKNPPSSVLGLPASKPTPKPASRRGNKQSFESQFLPTVPMEDWWLVRDSAGHTGWMLSRDIQVDVPEDVAQYSENERMVGAYVLRTVNDSESGKPNGQVPEYLTVLTPYRSGLPYDFDQVRVFTWDTKRHRYGTAFRLRDIAGFFPVKVVPGNANDPAGLEPIFSFHVAENNQVSLDAQTGRAQAAHLSTLTFRLEGNLVRKVLPPGEQSTHPKAGVQHHGSTTRRRGGYNHH